MLHEGSGGDAGVHADHHVLVSLTDASLSHLLFSWANIADQAAAMQLILK